ncbi:MAG: hypothetical protein KUG77_05560 [Nannocystaceae bacterium]|nr:hypothetical protein [Nannocystaceae bacterium]
MIVFELIAPVLFVRWQSRCDVADVERITEAIESAFKSVGTGLVYVASIPVGVAPPDHDARAAMRLGAEHAGQRCSSVHVVIEGQGLRRAIIRSVSAGLLLATRASFSIHTDAEEALNSASQRIPFEFPQILAVAREKGLIAA